MIKDPEKPETLEDLGVVYEDGVNVSLNFTQKDTNYPMHIVIDLIISPHSKNHQMTAVFSLTISASQSEISESTHDFNKKCLTNL